MRWIPSVAVASVLCAMPTLDAQAKEYVVKLRDFSSLTQVNQINGHKVLDRHEIGKLVKIDIDETDARKNAAILADIYSNPVVEYIVPNVKFQAFGTPNDPKYGQQWALNKVKAANAWELNAGSSEVVVAVIDTGIDWKHEDLKDNIYENPGEIPNNGVDDDGNGFVDDVRGWDFRYNDNDPMDETSAQNPGHGTHCAGIVAASFNNGVGIAGMAPSVSLLPVRFLGSDGSGDLLAGAKAIDYAVSLGVDVISASWGARVSKDQVQPILEAIERAAEKNIAFVVAAANDGANNDTTAVYPANAESANVINVAASTSSDTKPSWSNYGRARVHVASPGEGIYSTLPGNKYGNLSGTSMATPLVAGLVGLIKSQGADGGPVLSPLEIRSVLQTTGSKVAIETACFCRVDADAALKHVANEALTVVPAALTVPPGSTATFTGLGGTAPYTFESSDPAIASITEAGELTAKAEGEVTLTIKDAQNQTTTSKTIFINELSEGGGGGGGGQCPFEDPATCDLLCQINPSFPWCS